MTSSVGRTGKISGLKKREDLNGAEGFVQNELSDGRLMVLTTNSSSPVISIKRENFIFIQPAEVLAGTNIKVWQNVGYFYPCKISFLIPTNFLEAVTSLSPSPYKF